MSTELRALLDAAKGKQPPTDELEAQVRSFAYGNLAIEEPGTSRLAIDRAFEIASREL